MSEATEAPPAENPAGQVETRGARALQIREQQPPLLAKFEAASTQEKIRALLPSTLSFDRFARLTVGLIYRQPELSECDPVSFFSCLSDCALIGIYPEAVTGKCYLIPRWNKKLKRKVCTLLVGYKGLREIALRSPEILDLWTGVVRNGDTFRIIRAPRQELQHEPMPQETGEIVGIYSIAALRNGLTSFEWMTIGDLEKVRNQSQAGLEAWQVESSPWSTWFTEMARKTVFRRHFKSLPIRSEDQEVLTKEAEGEERAIKNVTATVEGPSEPSGEAPASRPEMPARRGGARAVAEAAQPALPAPSEPSGTPEEAPKPEPAKPTAPAAGVSTPAPTRRRPAAATVAPATPPPAESSPPAAVEAAKTVSKTVSTPPPAASGPIGEKSKCPEIAPGVTLAGFHGKAWPQVIQFEVVEAVAAPYGSKSALVDIKVTADGYKGHVFCMEGAALNEQGAPMLTSKILKPGALLEANWNAVPRSTGGVTNYTRPPVIVISAIDVQKEDSTF